jgi:DNA-binding NarL/FixJ family response regulator
MHGANAKREPVGVLVVDDSPQVLSAFLDLLQELPQAHVVGVALTVEDGLDLAFLSRPEVVLVDAGMPDCLRMVVAARALMPGARIAALTTCPDAGVGAELLARGADAYASKSADLTTLLRSLTR